MPKTRINEEELDLLRRKWLSGNLLETVRSLHEMEDEDDYWTEDDGWIENPW